MPHLRPKNVVDIHNSRGASYAPLARRLNLNRRKSLFLPFSAAGCGKALIVLAAAWTLILGSVAAPTAPTFAASNADERAALESQLKVLEDQITQYETQISSYEKQGKSLKGEIHILNDKVSKLNTQIAAVTVSLKQLDQKINSTQDQIRSTQDSIETDKVAVASLLKTMYETDQANLMEIFLKNPKLSDFFSDLNNIGLVQENVRATIAKITDLKDQLESQKEQYTLARADAATLRDFQAEQKQETSQVVQQKNTLLAQTKGQESKYQQMLKVTKATAAQIKARLFELLGGGELTFEKAYDYAKMAGDATGVRPALVLAILDRESALGKNVGRCTWQRAMSPSNQKIYVQLVAQLNIDPNSMMVSCPNADGPYGGAMGPAQFMPTTWMLYQGQIARISGHNPPSPWNNADAFVATALYLKDAGALTSEKMAAAKYYCGSSWNRYVCTSVYGRAVVDRANHFQDDIDTMNGS